MGSGAQLEDLSSDRREMKETRVLGMDTDRWYICRSEHLENLFCLLISGSYKLSCEWGWVVLKVKKERRDGIIGQESEFSFLNSDLVFKNL